MTNIAMTFEEYRWIAISRFSLPGDYAFIGIRIKCDIIFADISERLIKSVKGAEIIPATTIWMGHI